MTVADIILNVMVCSVEPPKSMGDGHFVTIVTEDDIKKPDASQRLQGIKSHALFTANAVAEIIKQQRQ